MRWARILAVAAAALSALLAAPAPAQLPPARSGMSSGWTATNLDAVKEIASFGRCYAKTVPKDVLKVLATTPGTQEEADVFAKVLGEDMPCMSTGSGFRMPLPYIRGAMVEGYYVAHLPIPASLRLPAPAPAEVRSLSDAARCYAAGHLSETVALLATPAGSREEHDAVARMLPDLRACISGGGQVRLDATLVRFRLAEALIHLAPPSGSQ